MRRVKKNQEKRSRGVLANLVRRCPDPVAIYRVASRYTSLMVSGAANLHGQVPPELLEGFDGECFASPLNAHLPRFYSPFPEIDAPFGSLGSFFASPPKEGTWECNPPFSEELMCRMVDVLIGAKFLIVPFWEDSAAIQKLMKHPHRVIKKHYYIAGVGGKRFSPPNPTLVAFVGGDQGFVDSFVKKWEASC
jgi:hypothetical protein